MSPEQLLGSDFGDDPVVIADCEAGIGTMTRLEAGSVDAVVVVCEPTAKSVEVAARAADLAAHKELGEVVVVVNRVRDDDDVALVRQRLSALGVTVGVYAVPEDREIATADRDGLAPLDVAPEAPAVRALIALGQHLVARGEGS